MKLTRKQYRSLPEDYRSTLGGEPRALVLDRSRGATVLVPVELVDEVMPGECSHAYLRLERSGRGDRRPGLGLMAPATLFALCPTCGVAGPSAGTGEAARAAFLGTYPPAPLSTTIDDAAARAAEDALEAGASDDEIQRAAADAAEAALEAEYGD